MWEHAQGARALLIFAEHRFFGESWPCGGAAEAQAGCLHLLTHEQAMADYVQLLATLKATIGAEASPVIAFGGSYGGMLAAWLRVKYPGTFAGAIAASGKRVSSTVVSCLPCLPRNVHRSSDSRISRPPFL